MERWLAAKASEDMSARNRNAYREAVMAFCNWCVENQRMVSNPRAGLRKANERIDPRRPRRAFTQDELVRLLDATRRRPVLEVLTIRHGPRRGEAAANVRPVVIKECEVVGLEHALIYKNTRAHRPAKRRA